MVFLLLSLLITGTYQGKRVELENSRTASIDNQICRGLALILLIDYFFAGFHKLNTAFLSFDANLSPGVEAIDSFLAAGKISSHAPQWLLGTLLPGILFCEMIVPTVMLSFAAVREFFILVMFAFHFPMISTMGASDYPMIIVAFYPTLFSRSQWSTVEDELLRRWNWMNLMGALLGVFTHLWFTVRWTPNTSYGILVAALWGFAAVALARCCLNKARHLMVEHRSTA